MQVFISWSGARSRAVAVALADWLSQVIQAVDPWISLDIEKGARWSPEISGRLEASKVGIVCLTRDNLDSRWILFEAGALSKTKDAYVCTLLLDILPSDVGQPLGQFQHTARDRNEVLQLVRTINRSVEKCGERALPEARLEEVFDIYWPKLAQSLDTVASDSSHEDQPSVRTERQLLEELLELTRANERRLASLTQAQRVEKGVRDYLTHYWTSKAHDPKHLFTSYYTSARPDLSPADLDLLFRVLKDNASRQQEQGEQPDRPPESDPNDA